MKFKDIKSDRERRFSSGVEEQSGKYYVSIPVSNPYIDYEEFYEISEATLKQFESDMTSAIPFVEACRQRKNDHLLIQKPGKLRGCAS